MLFIPAVYPNAYNLFAIDINNDQETVAPKYSQGGMEGRIAEDVGRRKTLFAYSQGATAINEELMSDNQIVTAQQMTG